MEWELEWGEFQAVLESYRRRGQPVAALDNKPVLELDLLIYWQAFTDLSFTRDVGFSHQAIKFQEIQAWFELQGIDNQESRETYMWLIRKMDVAWITNRRKRK